MNSFRSKLFLLVGFLYINLFANADLIPIKSIETVLEFIDEPEDLIVIFDIDDTLVKKPPGLSIGCRAWWKHLRRKAKENHLFPNFQNSQKETSSPLAIQTRLNEIKMLITLLPVIPVEETTSLLIKKIQSKNIPIMLLTGRLFISEEMAKLTYQQLLSVGIEINTDSIQKSDGLPFYNGILFTDGSLDKATRLFDFFEKQNKWPKKIIVIDDDRRALESFLYLPNHPISIATLYYQPMHLYQPEKFNLTIAEIQLTHLVCWNELLWDDEIDQMLKKRCSQHDN